MTLDRREVSAFPRPPSDPPADAKVTDSIYSELGCDHSPTPGLNLAASSLASEVEVAAFATSLAPEVAAVVAVVLP